jgi:hypothetical protein
MEKTIGKILIVLTLVATGLFFYLKPSIDDLDYVVVGCTIYNNQFEVIEKKDGDECFFFSQGKFASFQRSNRTLSFHLGPNLQPWKKIENIVDVFSMDSKGNIIAQGYEFGILDGIENVKFDIIYKVDGNGELIKKFSFKENIFQLLDRYSSEETPKAFKLFNHEQAEFKYVITQLASTYEIPFDVIIDQKLIAPKGSFVTWSNAGAKTLIIIDENFSKILYHRPLKALVAHDVQFVDKNVVLYFENSTRILNKNIPARSKKGRGRWARLTEVNIEKRKKEFDFTVNLFGETGGSVQRVKDGLYLIMDYKVDEAIETKDLSQAQSQDRRLMLYSKYFGIIKMLDIKASSSRAKNLNLTHYFKK